MYPEVSLCIILLSQIVGESPMVLLLTFAISMLHLIFEFLAMSSNWAHVKDMVADPSLNKSLSVTLFTDNTCVQNTN